jgi:hypothetical protein
LVVPGFPKAAVAVIAASACALAASRLTAYSSGPPPGHTAGFGEPACTACHYDYVLNEPGATIRLDSLPRHYTAGQKYPLTLVVRHAALKRGGFQLSARFADGTQGGAFVMADTLLLTMRGKAGIEFLSHTMAGADRVSGDSITWRFLWVAPASRQAVVFNVAVNVSNRDASEFGDRIFARSFETSAQ